MNFTTIDNKLNQFEYNLDQVYSILDRKSHFSNKIREQFNKVLDQFSKFSNQEVYY